MKRILIIISWKSALRLRQVQIGFEERDTVLTPAADALARPEPIADALTSSPVPMQPVDLAAKTKGPQGPQPTSRSLLEW
jgi:hypothetical protein